MDRWFPLWNIKNIRIYYLLGIFTNFWFIAGNWLFFWLRYMTFGQLGIMDASVFAFGLMMEVPSGAIADLIGKKRTINWSMGLSGIGIMLMAFANNMNTIWIGFLIAQLGWAFYSGSAEALAYDSLVEIKKEKEYEKVASVHGTISSITIILSTLLGGIMYVWWFRSTHFFWGIGFFVALIMSFKLVEPSVDSEKFSLSNYFAQIVGGTKQLFKPILLPFVLMGARFLYELGLVRPTIAQSFGFLDREQAIIFSIISTLGAIAVSRIPQIRKFVSDKLGLYFLTIVMGIGFVLTFFNLGIYGLIPMLLIGLTGDLSTPWVSIVVNDEIESKYRATTLSAVALLAKIPYVLLAVIAGSMAEKGTFSYFSLGVGIVILVSVLIGMLMDIRKKAIKS